MTDITRSRAKASYADMLQNLTLQRLLKWLRPGAKTPHIRRLDARLARDIGLSAADLERHQLQWPSQTTHHPRG